MSNLEDHEAEQARITAIAEKIDAEDGAHKHYIVTVGRSVIEHTFLQLSAICTGDAVTKALRLSGRVGTIWKRDEASAQVSEPFVQHIGLSETIGNTVRYAGLPEVVDCAGVRFRVFSASMEAGVAQGPVCRESHLIWDHVNGYAVGFYLSGPQAEFVAAPSDFIPARITPGISTLAQQDLSNLLGGAIKRPQPVSGEPDTQADRISEAVGELTHHVMDMLFYNPQTDEIPDDDTRASDAMATLTIGGARKAISEAIREGYREIAPDAAPAVGKCEVVSTAHPDIAILMLPLGGAMILHIKPGADFMTAKLIRQYVSQDAAVAWCDGYARRMKEGRQ